MEGNGAAAALEREEAQRRAEGYLDAVARQQDQRALEVRSALAAGAAFLTLMSASATGRVAVASAPNLRTAQFLLCLLFAGSLAYYLSTIYGQTLSIADDGARRLELEESARLSAMEGRHYGGGARTWRRREWIPTRVLAGIPRWGQSQRQALLLGPVVAMLPAAWFGLVEHPSAAQDFVIGAAAALLAAMSVRLLLSGCRHWLWVHPRTLEPRRSAITLAAPIFGWWFFRLGADGPLARTFRRLRRRWQNTPDDRAWEDDPDVS